MQLRFLIFLRFHDERYRTVTGLSREFNISKATASDAIRSLEDKGIITRVRDKLDRRIMILSLSTEGREIADCVSEFGNVIKTPLSEIRIREKEIFFSVLIKLLGEFHVQEIISPLRMCILCKNLRVEISNGKQLYCQNRGEHFGSGDMRVDCRYYEYGPEHDMNMAQFFP